MTTPGHRGVSEDWRGRELVVCADVGSTYTKVLVVDVERGELVASAGHPTTVGTDVLDGLDAAIAAAAEGLPGADLSRVLACSSAGGGLRLAVVGYEALVTAEAGHRVGLSAGARVVHVAAGRLDGAGVRALRAARPDVVLLVGGTDGGDADVLTHNATRLAAARLRSGRAGSRPASRVPVVLAGNADAVPTAEATLSARGVPVTTAANVLPRIGELRPGPARAAIRDVFLRHVIGGKGLSRGPRFARLVRGATPDLILTAVELLADGIPHTTRDPATGPPTPTPTPDTPRPDTATPPAPTSGAPTPARAASPPPGPGVPGPNGAARPALSSGAPAPGHVTSPTPSPGVPGPDDDARRTVGRPGPDDDARRTVGPSMPGVGELVVVDVGGATTDVYSVLTPDAERNGPGREAAGTLWRSRTVEADLGVRWSAPGVVEAAVAERLIDAAEAERLAVAAAARAADPALLPDPHPLSDPDLASVGGLTGRGAVAASDATDATVAAGDATDATGATGGGGVAAGRGGRGVGGEAAADARLAELAVVVALRRHARGERGSDGVRRGGKDLRRVRLVVGSGGVLRHAPEGVADRVLAAALADHAGGWALPVGARRVVDDRYVLAAVGLLARDHPAAAARLARAHLGLP